MTLLHVYFTLRNQQAFQRLLERDRSAATPQAGQSTSTGKSWTRKNIVSALEVNALDFLGRTVLHLACASTEPASLEYARLLLGHPFINVNIPDKENHWTALHRALYAGNIEAAIMLLKRTDTDTSIKDMEGYTAFDLYNSTVQSANPTSLQDGFADLLTWGTNRNAALGLGDSNDRTHPDYVVVLKKDAPLPTTRTLEERFQPVKVRNVIMSKLHTAILTDEPRNNVRLCGFGSGGRLGPFSHTLYTPTPLVLFSNAILSVALGQDHTLALTSAGEVISWGLNRFAQLGYAVEAGQGGSADESIQTTPRKINHLKKESIKGIATCKTASTCWSENDVWTWGTNGGQLGYSKAASPVQVLPRKVSIITHPICGIAMSETAMVCLFVTGEVVCVWNGSVSKISFPAHAFPSGISTIYRPPQAVRAPPITKLAFCEDLFAALSSNGEVFTFSPPTVTDAEDNVPGVHLSRGQVKPQRAWGLRRQFSSVRDVDVGGDGALVVCTQSGHVFVRSRNLKGGTTSSGTKAFKFQRVAYVQRAVAVCANSTGAFGALRVDYKPPPIIVTGKQFSADMAAIAPYTFDEATLSTFQAMAMPLNEGPDEDLEDSSILQDITQLAKLTAILSNQMNRAGSSVKGSKHGADLAIRTGTEFEVLTHRVVLATRCVPLRDVLGSDQVLCDDSTMISITFASPVLYFTGTTPLSLLILLHYLYSDEVLAVWDRRVESFFEEEFSSLGFSASRVKADLITLSRLLCLPHLASALQSVGKRVANLSACGDFQGLFNHAQLIGSARRNLRQDPLAPDVALHLADKIIYTHSVVLRARSAFFAGLFSDPDWTVDRRDDAGMVDVEMGHSNWQVLQFVLPFICFGEEAMFETLEFLDNVDEVLEFMFHVISTANELLLTRLVLLCSQVVLKYLNAYNACYLLTDAIHFNAIDLADRIQRYMTANIESLLESRILDDLDSRVVRKLSEHTRSEQAIQSPISRSNKLGRAALEKHKEWLASQDIPGPVVPNQKLWSGKDSPKASPPGSVKKGMGRQFTHYSPTTSPVLLPSVALQPAPPGDEIFAMDDADGGPSLKLSLIQPSTCDVESARPGWKKNPVTPRTDLKVIMAEAEKGKRQVHTKALDGDPSARLGVGSANASTIVSAVQGVVPVLPQQPPPTPRRVPSDLAMPQKPETPTRNASRATQANPCSSQSIMGPVIIPVRQTPSGSASAGNSSRKPSLGGAWTLPPVQPIAEPTVPSLLSFAEIQKMQALQGSVPKKGKQSLRDIQEEERANRQEAEFLKWWAAEEERVRVEMEREGEGEGAKRGGGRRARRSKAESESLGTQQRESRGHRRGGTENAPRELPKTTV